MPVAKPRDKAGKSFRSTLSRQEYKRLDALFRTTSLVVEIAEAQRMLTVFVDEARKNGATWVDIGEAAGISAQAAHQRWSVNKPDRTIAGRKSPTKRRKPNVPVKREVQQKLLV